MKNSVDFSIAIPDSALIDEQTKRDKSIKISQFARACSIFKVKKIFLYHDALYGTRKEELTLLSTVLRYLDTPQYLRKRLYPMQKELEYAGILHPIRAPHHKLIQNIKDIRKSDVRVGIVKKVNNENYVDVGLNKLIPFRDTAREGEKVNAKFISSFPILTAARANAQDIRQYWGYEVEIYPELNQLLRESTASEVIITSRKGQPLKSIEKQLIPKCITKGNILLVFGSPKSEVMELLDRRGSITNSHANKERIIVNTIPGQGTETVRLEEAILSTLAIFNHILER